MLDAYEEDRIIRKVENHAVQNRQGFGVSQMNIVQNNQHRTGRRYFVQELADPPVQAESLQNRIDVLPGGLYIRRKDGFEGLTEFIRVEMVQLVDYGSPGKAGQRTLLGVASSHRHEPSFRPQAFGEFHDEACLARSGVPLDPGQGRDAAVRRPGSCQQMLKFGRTTQKWILIGGSQHAVARDPFPGRSESQQGVGIVLERRGLRQYVRFKPAKGRPRIDAKFLGEDPAGASNGGQRVTLPAAAVEGQHQQLPRRLTQRRLPQDSFEACDGLGKLSQGQRGSCVPFPRRAP
ncbi:hypothetical protein LVY72_20835 [Arthrobacter sp. I2-34]|uniref:Uncharacterized protein n=1 Tax=Arthrobacter hankyongi TaxID=2904801 RepID=A0ABS9LCE8_9MICC|nr:hypothetical protein [Arthrobacter hankyongi]MCG2624341.1 hypothetical protein [Arthrobacter hankyongi]